MSAFFPLQETSMPMKESTLLDESGPIKIKPKRARFFSKKIYLGAALVGVGTLLAAVLQIPKSLPPPTQTPVPLVSELESPPPPPPPPLPVEEDEKPQDTVLQKNTAKIKPSTKEVKKAKSVKKKATPKKKPTKNIKQKAKPKKSQNKNKKNN